MGGGHAHHREGHVHLVGLGEGRRGDGVEAGGQGGQRVQQRVQGGVARRELGQQVHQRRLPLPHLCGVSVTPSAGAKQQEAVLLVGVGAVLRQHPQQRLARHPRDVTPRLECVAESAGPVEVGQQAAPLAAVGGLNRQHRPAVRPQPLQQRVHQVVLVLHYYAHGIARLILHAAACHVQAHVQHPAVAVGCSDHGGLPHRRPERGLGTVHSLLVPHRHLFLGGSCRFRCSHSGTSRLVGVPHQAHPARRQGGDPLQLGRPRGGNFCPWGGCCGCLSARLLCPIQQSHLALERLPQTVHPGIH
mmetsp:Transcript_17221/g.51509  ORF Transcript_17221/g.51509 Transcript_17221/m.51509 type:complete len:302 (+) Transcript_17221:2879-3784(+)